jgi:hypothetical protein
MAGFYAKWRYLQGMNRCSCRLVDTWGDFLDFWVEARLKDADAQIGLWQTRYMDKYPELLTKQVKSYEEANVKWQTIAKRVFSRMPSRIRLMRKARDNVREVYMQVFAKASESLMLDFSVVFVIYVGIGCGAGWATTYQAQPAVLVGLENVADEKWHRKSTLEGMISHELGHLAHMAWRKEWASFEKAEQDPLFQLYSEGFAQKCEHLILGKDSWHMTQEKDWLYWCERNRSWLAKEFLRRLEKHLPVNDFFGSWFNIKEKKQTGYYLGLTFIRMLETTCSLKEIATFNTANVRNLGIEYLRSASNEISA